MPLGSLKHDWSAAQPAPILIVRLTISSWCPIASCNSLYPRKIRQSLARRCPLRSISSGLALALPTQFKTTCIVRSCAGGDGAQRFECSRKPSILVAYCLDTARGRESGAGSDLRVMSAEISTKKNFNSYMPRWCSPRWACTHITTLRWSVRHGADYAEDFDGVSECRQRISQFVSRILCLEIGIGNESTANR